MTTFARMMVACAVLVFSLLAERPAQAHEGHDHDKPPPLNLPVAPRVIALTPDFELVGVVSGKERLTIFLHAFQTNEPIKGARMIVSSGANSAEAKSEGDGMFSLSAPWLASSAGIDLEFMLTLQDGTQDLLTGRLQAVGAAPTVAPDKSKLSLPERLKETAAGVLRDRPAALIIGGGSFMTGVLLTLLVAGFLARRRARPEPEATSHLPSDAAAEAQHFSVDGQTTGGSGEATPLRRGAAASVAMICVAIAFALSPSLPARAADPAQASQQQRAAAPVMATDLAQRMSDGSLFVPMATQHLLSFRTLLTAKKSSPRSVEIPGVVIAGPENFGRVQSGRPGRIEGVPGGLAYVGKRVEKGEVLALVQPYIESADRANMDSQVAETEARITKNKVILSRYKSVPGSVPQVKIDELVGEIDALTRKRAELMPAAAVREPVRAPIGGVISVANAALGQIVEARDVLFEIVDPSQFWVEAHGHGHEFVREGFAAAHAVVAGGHRIPLHFAGRGPALRHQAALLMFKVVEKQTALSIGMPIRVLLQSTATVEGYILPASAIIRAPNGLPMVWIKAESERFEPQIVAVEAIDGVSVLVVSGLRDDQRVVTDGATLLSQVR